MIKKEKYFYVESIQDLDLDYIKKTKAKLIIRDKIKHDFSIIHRLISECKKKTIAVYISNNTKLLFRLRLNTFYISSSNHKQYNWLNNINKNIKIIGGAHNQNEIIQKINQGCQKIILSRLFKTSYKDKKSYFGVIKFNLISIKYPIKIVPLGGINVFNLLKLNMVNSKSLALLSEIKKKPVISNRLF